MGLNRICKSGVSFPTATSHPDCLSGLKIELAFAAHRCERHKVWDAGHRSPADDFANVLSLVRGGVDVLCSVA